ncbi:MAG: SPOR domain-containing protein [SAR324 cluster bacterium]|nr:SPOR domain-containing protein [SAR324 cluster bacterium]
MAVQQPPLTKKKPQGNGAQFTLDMDIKGLSLILTLMALTMVVVFYLGIIYGKAMRNPADLALSPGLNNAQNIIPPKDLKIYDVRQTNEELKALQSDFASASKKSDRLQRAEEQLSTDEKTRKSKEAATQKSMSSFQVDDLEKTRENKVESPAEVVKETVKKPESDPGVNWPEQVLSDNPQKTNETLYSVQIMATRSRDKAANIIKQLSLKRFEAYMVEGKVGDTTIYRVRVGKDNKGKIRVIKERLKKTVKGLGSKLPIIQIN